MIKLFNTLTNQVDEVKLIDSSKAGIYTCGPTVYDFAHIGNFRSFVFEDLLRRVFEVVGRDEGFQVTHVMNLTDVDDKTIAGAIAQGRELDDYTAAYISAFNDDLYTLNILPPSIQPRATREVNVAKGMLELIQKLIDKGVAYESDGSVYYRVSKFPGYGKLSKKKLDQNIKGARIDVDEYDKEEGADFVLWKKSKEGEPFWDSPWGKGRPGWHLECSAMSMKYLGETFDLHAGGEDLIFPHHENEIAQSEAATGKPFVKHWIHCKFLLVEGEKMSKSKGNFYTLRQLLDKGYDPMAIRHLLMSTHYRSPLNFTFDGIRESNDTIKRLDDCYYQCLSHRSNAEIKHGADYKLKTTPLDEALKRIYLEILESLKDDLNISEALAAYYAAVKEINKSVIEDLGKLENDFGCAIDFFRKTDYLLGLDIASGQFVDEEVLSLIVKRFEIRSHDNFKTDKELQTTCDKLRDNIQSKGVEIKDGKLDQLPAVKVKRRTWDL